MITGVCETAAALLGLADEAGLTHLRAVALDFAVMHFDPVAKTAAWAALPRSCAEAVAVEVSCVGRVLCDTWRLGEEGRRKCYVQALHARTDIASATTAAAYARQASSTS